MTAKEVIEEALRNTGLTQYAAANLIGWQGQQLSQRLARGSLRADEMLEILDKMGIDVTFTVRASGKTLTSHIPGAGRRVRGICDKVVYDTSNANALSNSFWSDGENEYTEGRATELYVDDSGRYFLAEYSNVEGERDKVTVISAELAAVYIEKYGTQIFKHQ